MGINIQGAYKEYNGTRVLDIDNLRFENGYIYGIMGLNGSGKSTLLECLSGINCLTYGTITYEDFPAYEVRQNISVMTQKTYLFDTSVYDNIAMGLKFRKYGKDEINKRVNKYLSYFDMKNILYKNAKTLSGGEGAKTSLLRTAVLETGYVFLDEPTASMDAESTIKAESLIKDIQKRKSTVIVVTHDLYQAERIADYIIFMDKGKVIDKGDRRTVLKSPGHNLVRKILNL